MKYSLLPLIFLVAFGLLAAAVAVDCVRLASDARSRVRLADDELKKHEDRLATLIAGSPQLSPEVKTALATYRTADDPPARHAAYQQLVTIFRQTMSQTIDATNPLMRKFMDDTAGTINRREIAEKPYEEEYAAYRGYLASWRGRIARMFSPAARADFKSAR